MHVRRVTAGMGWLGALAFALIGCGRSPTRNPAAPPGAVSETRPGNGASATAAKGPRTVPAPMLDVREAARFETMARATITAIDDGNRAEVVAHITALEGAWDAKEDLLRPKGPATWRVLDVILDRAIAALRGSRTNLPRGRAALEELIAGLDRASLGLEPDPGAPPALPAAPVAAATKPAAAYTATETAPFVALARETIELLEAKETPRAVARLTDLEAAWDAREAALRPRDPATWTLLDDTLDRAIGALRSTDAKDLPAGTAALRDLLRGLDQATIPASSRPGAPGR